MIARAICLCAAVMCGPALAQGFAGLGTEAEGYALPDPDHVWLFPADHGPHPSYRIEWWYLTATLEAADGTQYGIQWTLFRAALTAQPPDGWGAEQIWMGHAGLTSAINHFTAERLARGGIGQAGVIAEPFEAWIDDWAMTSRSTAGQDALDRLSLSARGADFAYSLDLAATGPLVFHGDAGYSVKSADGQASHYYSQPFYEVTGMLDLPGGPVEVTGQGWLDREWSSQPLSPNQTGWDWISLSFDDGGRLMGFRLRDSAAPAFVTGTWISADGASEPIPPGAITLTPRETAEVAGRDIPIRWQVTVPAHGLNVELDALNRAAWMDMSFPYWEGPVTVTGSHEGRGYLEMTGYD